MDKWNKSALVSLRGKLKQNVVMNTGLTDTLEKEAGGFMSHREAEVVRNMPNDAEKMEKLIQILCGKGNSDFETFCEMLRQCSYKLWADKLEKKARKFNTEAGNHVHE